MKIFIAIPAYDSKIYSHCCTSVMMNKDRLIHDGHKVVVQFQNGNCYIEDARNKLADTFLKSDSDCMIFVDADVAFDDMAMTMLVATDKTIVGGAYPAKYQNNPYPLSVITDENNMLVRDGNYFECNYLPTGLLKIHRGVYNRYKKAFPNDIGGGPYPLYFQNKVTNSGCGFYGEDVYFCIKCREMGEKIWCYPNIDFEHIGTQAIKGNYYKYLKEACK